MSDLSIGKLIVPTLMTTGAVFTALSAPVVMFAETPISVTQGKSQLYRGTVRDGALPYLMLAGVTSVGLGISGVAVAGWRKSAKKAEKLSDDIQSQQQQREERQAHLNAALGSETYLEKTGLDFFLEDGELPPFEPQALPVAKAEPIAATAQTRIESKPVIAQRPTVATKRPVVAAPPTAPVQELSYEDDFAAQLAWLDGEADMPAVTKQPQPAPQPKPQQRQQPQTRPAKPMPPAVPPQRTPRPVAQRQPASAPQMSKAQAPLTAAQGFYGYTRGQETPSSAKQPQYSVNRDGETIARIQSLQNQLQAIVTQIEALQANLPAAEETIQVVENYPSSQSGLVEQGFQESVEQPTYRTEQNVQPIRRRAS